MECHYAKYEKYFDKYDFCAINIRSCDSSPIMKLNITKDDILNTIEIGYNSLHKVIKNSKNFKLGDNLIKLLANNISILCISGNFDLMDVGHYLIFKYFQVERH